MIKKISDYLTMIIYKLYSERSIEKQNKKVLHTILKNDLSAELRDNEEVIQKFRGKKIGFVFQDPQTSLNPLFKIKDQLIETIQINLDIR